MLSIFTIHSPITFFLAHLIIQKEKLKAENVIVISFSYKLPFKIGSKEIDYYNLSNSFISKIYSLNLPVNFDKLIYSLTDGKEFVAYIDLMHNYQKILITNPKCISFNFFEEGTASYTLPDNIDFITRTSKNIRFRNNSINDLADGILKLVRGYNSRLLSIPHHPQAFSAFPYIKYYSISEFAYPLVDTKKKRILRVDEQDSFYQSLPNLSQSLDNSIIWVEEPFFKNNGFSEHEYETVVKNTIKLYLSKVPVNEIYIKLRPGQKQDQSILYRVLSDTDINVHTLSNDIPLEYALVISKNLVLIGIVSSLLFYARIFGHQSFSVYKLFGKNGVKRFNNWGFYWKTVKGIEEFSSLENHS